MSFSDSSQIADNFNFDNQVENITEEGQCPECKSQNTFKANWFNSYLKKKVSDGFICRDCWNKF